MKYIFFVLGLIGLVLNDKDGKTITSGINLVAEEMIKQYSK